MRGTGNLGGGVGGVWFQASVGEHMADLFEQIVADYLTEEGYLTKLNVNYRKADGKGPG